MAKLSKDVSLGENVVIGDKVSIGRGTTIGQGVIIHPDTRIGRDVTIYDNAVLGRRPHGTDAVSRRIETDLPPLRIGDGCVIGACAVLYRGTTIRQRTLVGDLASIREECVIGDDVIIARGVTINYNTRVGNNTKVMDNTHLTGDMIIEDHVFIGPLVASMNDNSMGRDPQGDKNQGGPRIRKGASIGGGASLLPNVVVGEYAVVGSGAVVSRDVPPRKVVVGIPARVVKNVPVEWLPLEEDITEGGATAEK